MAKDIENEIQSWIAVRSFTVEDANPQAPIIDANELAEFVTAVFKNLEGYVLVPVELSESVAEKLAFEKVEKPRQENDVVWQEIADKAYSENLKIKKFEIKRDYKELVEAARGGNDIN